MELEVDRPDGQRVYCRVTFDPSHWDVCFEDANGFTIGGHELIQHGDLLSGDELIKAVERWVRECVEHRRGFS
jgi:hypothetical protein